MTESWKFDSRVAENFVSHAEKHIPNYYQVIDKSIDVCKQLCNTDSSIIDVGCATGHTLERLSQEGFVNLTGVDSSTNMLNLCDVPAKLIWSDQFPDETFDAVLCNWTLHFVKTKIDYLNQMYQGLNNNGFMILSEKTSLDPLPIHFYHKHKSQQGVSDAEIKQKEQSIKDIMFIDSPAWYLKTLSDIGFSKVYIIDAHWCFTTFLCLK
jgi:SAM-dependent methyltransferase